jgi:hypothetical protein
MNTLKTERIKELKPKITNSPFVLLSGLLLSLLYFTGCQPMAESIDSKANKYDVEKSFVKYTTGGSKEMLVETPTDESAITDETDLIDESESQNIRKSQKQNTNGKQTSQVVTGTPKKLVNIPYTISGNEKEFSHLQKDIGSQSDTLTAMNIESVSLTAPRWSFDLIIQLKGGKQLHFSAIPKSENKMFVARNIEQVVNSKNVGASDKATSDSFTADVVCTSQNCELAQIQLTNKLSHQKVGILYSVTHPKLKSRTKLIGTSARFEDVGFNKILLTDANIAVQKTSVSVVDGVSFSKIFIPNLLEIRTENLDTDKASIKTNLFEISGNPNYYAELIGNNPTTGSLIFFVENKVSKEHITLFIEDEAVLPVPKTVFNNLPTPNTDTPTNPIKPNPLNPPRVAKVTLVQPKIDASHPETSKVTQLFAAYENDPEVQRMIRVWKGEEQDSMRCRRGNYGAARVTNFLAHAPQISNYVEQVVEKIDVTPEIIYLLILESEYLIDGNYNTLAMPVPTKFNPNPTAMGPWQIIKGTALNVKNLYKIPFQIYPSRPHKPHLADDRIYFMNSTLLAGLLLKTLFEKYAQDPALAILSYKQGEAATDSNIRSTKKYGDYDVSLSDILKYRLSTRPNCRELNYVYSFLAARTIGQNLDKYGLDKITPVSTDKYKKRLFNASPSGLYISDAKTETMP